MSSVNKVILLGNLAREPELKYTATGTPVCRFTLVTNEIWYKDKVKQEKAEFHRITVFGKQGENCNMYLKKGNQAYIEGKIGYREVEIDGVKKYYTDIMANDVRFLSPVEKKEVIESSDMLEETYDLAIDNSFTADDIPF